MTGQKQTRHIGKHGGKRTVSQHTRADGNTQTANRLGGSFDTKQGEHHAAAGAFEFDDSATEVLRFREALSEVGAELDFDPEDGSFTLEKDGESVTFRDNNGLEFDPHNEGTDNARLQGLLSKLNYGTLTYAEWAERAELDPDEEETVHEFAQDVRDSQNLRRLLGDEDAHTVAIDPRFHGESNHWIGSPDAYSDDNPDEHSSWIGNDPELFPIDEHEIRDRDPKLWEEFIDQKGVEVSAPSAPSTDRAQEDASAWLTSQRPKIEAAEVSDHVQVIRVTAPNGNTFITSHYGDRTPTSTEVVTGISNTLRALQSSGDSIESWPGHGSIESRRAFNHARQLRNSVVDAFGHNAWMTLAFGPDED